VSASVFQEGTLVEQWDDDTRIYTSYDAEGTPTSRPYTGPENVVADANAAAAATRAAEETRRAAVKLIVTDLKAEKDRLDVVLAKTPAQITGGDTKDVARASKRIADAAIDIARLLTE
jgi:hypothetical protein